MTGSDGSWSTDKSMSPKRTVNCRAAKGLCLASRVQCAAVRTWKWWRKKIQFIVSFKKELTFRAVSLNMKLYKWIDVKSTYVFCSNQWCTTPKLCEWQKSKETAWKSSHASDTLTFTCSFWSMKKNGSHPWPITTSWFSSTNNSAWTVLLLSTLFWINEIWSNRLKLLWWSTGHATTDKRRWRRLRNSARNCKDRN